MAKKGNEDENNEIEAIDLISLLSLPENAESYERELSIPEEEIDLVALGKEQLQEEAEKAAKEQSVISKNSSNSLVAQKLLSPSSLDSKPSTPTVTKSIPKIIKNTHCISISYI